MNFLNLYNLVVCYHIRLSPPPRIPKTGATLKAGGGKWWRRVACRASDEVAAGCRTWVKKTRSRAVFIFKIIRLWSTIAIV